MSLVITPQGIQIQTFDEIFDELVAGYRSIYGADIDLSQNTQDGQRIGIEAKARHDTQVAVLELYNSLDVDLAEGVAIRRAMKYAGITVNDASYSTWDIAVTASSNVTLYSGYTIKDDAGQEWVKDTAVNLTTGTTTVTFRASNLGGVSGLIGSVIEQVTVIPEVTTLVATVSAVVGTDEETDFEARRRRNLSLENPSYSLVGSLIAKFNNLANVTDAYVYENKTNVYDAVLAMEAHSIWAVVEGGELVGIAEIMAKQKTGGTGEKGAVTTTYVETLPSGIIINHSFKIDRPTYSDLYIRMDATRVGVDPVDTALIENNLVAKTYRINDKVQAYTLYPIAGDGLTDNAFLANLEISLDGLAWTDGSLASIPGGKYVIDALNITITEIIP